MLTAVWQIFTVFHVTSCNVAETLLTTWPSNIKGKLNYWRSPSFSRPLKGPSARFVASRTQVYRTFSHTFVSTARIRQKAHIFKLLCVLTTSAADSSPAELSEGCPVSFQELWESGMTSPTCISLQLLCIFFFSSPPPLPAPSSMRQFP